jgi:hypothetical protein
LAVSGGFNLLDSVFKSMITLSEIQSFVNDLFKISARSLGRIAAIPFQPQHANSGTVEFAPSGESFSVGEVGGYDVDQAKELLGGFPRESVDVDVAYWQDYADQMEWPRLTDQECSTADCSIPLIVATVSDKDKNFLIIDGWHRIQKAFSRGQKVLQGFRLTQAETVQIFNATA